MIDHHQASELWDGNVRRLAFGELCGTLWFFTELMQWVTKEMGERDSLRLVTNGFGDMPDWYWAHAWLRDGCPKPVRCPTCGERHRWHIEGKRP